MSDFLSNLITRTLRPAEVIQPRLASLFEPSSGAGAAAPVEPESSAEPAAPKPAVRQEESASVIRPSLQRQQEGTRLAAVITPVSADGAPRRSPGTQGDALHRASSRVVESATVEPTPPPYPNPSGTSSMPGAKERVGSTVAALGLGYRVAQAIGSPGPVVAGTKAATAPEVASIAAAVGGPSATPHPVETAGRVLSRPALGSEPTGQVTIGRNSERAVGRAGHAARGERAAAPPSPSPVTSAVPIRSHAMRSLIEAVRPASRQSATAPEPTVHVTIGRVEVRAIPPQGPAQGRERSVPAVMSLDEYLRRRSGEGGR